MSPQVAWTHEAKFSPEPLSASRARHFVGSHLAAHRLPYLLSDVQLVVSELVTNAYLHARTPIRVRLEAFLYCVKLSVHDGSSARPLARVPGGLVPGGRGLAIVDECSVHWGSTAEATGGKSVWALFAVTPPSAEAPVACFR
jgi:anti-sigma regulatory factor (Ser/Thr protein kinase)